MIQIVKESGFCHGVQAAIDRANARFGDVATRGVYIYGDLANNRNVMNSFKGRGFIVSETPDEIPVGSIVIVRAHGIPRVVYDRLTEKNIIIEDCTCPKVKGIHKIVKEKSESGYRVIIIGKSGHPEVTGIYGWCKEGTAIIAETEADLISAFETFGNKVAVVAQTTCKKSWWDEAIVLIKTKIPGAEIFNTLCNVTNQRISDASDMAKNSEIMIVVGDEKSANSQELYSACREACEKTFFVTDLEELIEQDEEKILLKTAKTKAKIGIAGSASAPVEIINEIYDYLIFTNFLANAKREIEECADEYIKSEMENSNGKPFIRESVESLYDQNKGGKRIRGAMIKLGAELAGTSGSYLPVAVAYEIFQTAILIHDDIIDKSHTRRGKKTIHTKKAEEKLQNGLESDSANHFGISQAICIGDYGLFLANNILSGSRLEPEVLVKIFRLFSRIQLTTLEGEIMDVTLPYESVDIAANFDKYSDIVRNIFEYKTAWYTLVGPIMLGAICGGDEVLTKLLQSITLPLGIAFQIKDDLLGIYACEKVLGKPALSDLAEKKQTLLYGYAYKHANSSQRVRLDLIYGNLDATKKDLDEVRQIFDVTGAKQFAENEIKRLSETALKLIEDANFSPQHKSLLNGLVSYLITRRY